MIPTRIRGLLLPALSVLFATGVEAQSYSPLDRLARPTGQDMSFFTWIVVGLIAGFIGSKIVNRRGEGIVLDILLGIAGAFVGGWLLSPFGATGVTGLNPYSILVAVAGSVVLLLVYHVIRRSRSSYF
jgi:uncharacterized membrane protein YeaQ/YmgE (transglycosylase-associated protein family)